MKTTVPESLSLLSLQAVVGSRIFSEKIFCRTPPGGCLWKVKCIWKIHVLNLGNNDNEDNLLGFGLTVGQNRSKQFQYGCSTLTSQQVNNTIDVCLNFWKFYQCFSFLNTLLNYHFCNIIWRELRNHPEMFLNFKKFFKKALKFNYLNCSKVKKTSHQKLYFY